ncbi:MAG: methionyl-tRNA formyltransferase [Clostridia bacterium]|nr:methionyl-tRNA formyltransferase [Clostridia bacterium]
MNVVFMGTPEFAVPCLDILIEHYNVSAVFTQPDRPKGRGKQLAMSAVKERALKDNIPVYQPEKIKTPEMVKILRDLNPDVIVVVAYGQLLSQEILDIPPSGCINVHASLLPKYRGAAPINWAIVNGETESGVTTMYMAKGLDTGDMIMKSKVDIPLQMTGGELHDALSEKGKFLILRTLKAIERNEVEREPQDDALSSYAPLLDKEVSIINWEKSCLEVHNLVRGFNPWPIATTTFENEKMKIYRTEPTEIKAKGRPGQVVSVSKEGIFVNCADFQLKIIEIQMPNKKRMTVEAFILGHDLKKGIVLGE